MEQKLYEAAIQGSVTLLNKILEEDPLALGRVTFGCFGGSPLHMAALRGHTDFVKEVLCQNPDLAEVTDSSQRSPLHLASAKGHVEIVEALISVDPDMCLARDKDGENPLHLAVMKGKVDVLKLLVQANPSAAEVMDSSQRSPLHLASAKGHVEIVQELISVDPDMCIARDKDGRNPLHLAIMKGKVDVLKKLVQANPRAAEVRLDKGETILHLCVMRDQVESLKELLNTIKNKELVNAKDGGGSTILHLAVANKQVEILNYLLTNATVDVNIKNASEYTALDILAQIRKDAENLDDIGNKLQKENLDDIGNKLRKAGAMSGKGVGLHERLAKKKETLMLVATLIATIAFQAAVSPPGGVWQGNEGAAPSPPGAAPSPPGPVVILPGGFWLANASERIAGQAVMANYDPALYLLYASASTTAFVTSLSTILLLISGLPFKRTFLWILVEFFMNLTIISMAVAFAISILVITPDHISTVGYAIYVAIILWGVPVEILFIVHMVRLMIKAINEKRNQHLVTKRIKKFSSTEPHQGGLRNVELGV